MEIHFSYFILVIMWFECADCLKTSFQCTQQTNADLDNSDDNSIIQDEVLAKKLEINCGMDLIFIAWSHYGHETSKPNNRTNSEQR
jgi:hypothetical protein